MLREVPVAAPTNIVASFNTDLAQVFTDALVQSPFAPDWDQ